VLPALIFLGAALPVYLLCLRASAPKCGRTSCSATITLPAGRADAETTPESVLDKDHLAQAAKRANLSPERIRRALREKALRVSVGPSDRPDRTQVVITFEGRESPTFAAELVNALAEQFGQAERKAVAADARRAHEKARVAADQARTELFEIRARFNSFVDSCFAQLRQTNALGPSPEGNAARGTPAASSPAPSAPLPVILQPERDALARQLAALRDHRAHLLVDRTPMHPEVHAADVEIAELERRLAGIPHELVPSPSDLSQTLESTTGIPPASPDPVSSQPMPSPSPASPTTPTSPLSPAALPQGRPGDLVADYLARRDAMDRAQERYERLADVERSTYEAQFELPPVQVHRAVGAVGPATPVPSARSVLLALGVGLAGAVGMGMFSAGMSGERTFATGAELAETLSLSVLGTVPGAEPPTPRTRPRRTGDAWALLACGLALVTLCLGVLLALTFGTRMA